MDESNTTMADLSIRIYFNNEWEATVGSENVQLEVFAYIFSGFCRNLCSVKNIKLLLQYFRLRTLFRQ